MCPQKQLLFGTSNIHKLTEARKIIEPHGYNIQHYPVDLIELQNHKLESIAIYSLEQLPPTEHPIFVEDTGLFIEHLTGFPGPFAAYFFNTIGNDGIIKLLSGEENRNAYFKSVIAYRDEQNQIKTFFGRIDGKIANVIAGKDWGYDPIFIPLSNLNPDMLTFAKLDSEIKNKISHRALALHKLRNYLI